MTEIPEHLLKRSRERRAALGLGGGDAGASSGDESVPAATPASSTPATTAASPAPAPAAPVEVKPEPPKPVPAYVQAAQQRRRIPLWAMPVLAAVPLWGYVFFRTLDPPPVENDPLVLGEAVYSSCAGCHGGSGQGVSAPALADGAVLKTWPDYRDHMMWVRIGNKDWPSDTYGAQDKPNDRGKVMPGHPALDDQQLAQVVLYERQVLSKESPDDEEELLAIANGEMTFEEAGLGPISTEAGVSEDELTGG